MTVAAVVLAHQGGWDEVLLAAVPIAVFVLVLRLANKRADERLHETDASQLDGDSTTGS